MGKSADFGDKLIRIYHTSPKRGRGAMTEFGIIGWNHEDLLSFHDG
jgi:hypothetical protein